MALTFAPAQTLLAGARKTRKSQTSVASSPRAIPDDARTKPMNTTRELCGAKRSIVRAGVFIGKVRKAS